MTVIATENLAGSPQRAGYFVRELHCLDGQSDPSLLDLTGLDANEARSDHAWLSHPFGFSINGTATRSVRGSTGHLNLRVSFRQSVPSAANSPN